LLEEAVQAYEEKARDKNIEMELVLGESARNMKVLADRNAISTIAKNLLDNAVKYTPRGGLVRVTLQRNEPYARLIVCDNGIGIAPEDRHRIFDEFFRVRSEQTAGIAGTGLGLSLVEHLVNLHQGRITVQSTPGQGSIFTIEIPLAGCSKDA
jgi:two-component system phosphate regulon sensor histidine kinase PhoR